MFPALKMRTQTSVSLQKSQTVALLVTEWEIVKVFLNSLSSTGGKKNLKNI